MKIAIHNSKDGFHPRWIAYCKKKNISYKIVNCYANDIIKQLDNCDILFWHHSHSKPKDILFAKQLLFSMEQSGLLVFPDFNTAWHFDDKVGQKYLLEAVNAPLVNSFVFYSKIEALDWAENADFPKVFKLRGGSGSANVKLAENKSEAIGYINKAFSKGFRQYEPLTNLIERWRKYRNGLVNFNDVFKGILRFFKEPEFSKIIGYERGYVYFQEFIPNNNFDIRVIVIGNRGFALKRMVREGDFKASGSGDMKFAKEEFDERCLKIAFETNRKLKSQCLAYDFVFDVNNEPLIVEVSFGFAVDAYDSCPGYWDLNLIWNEESFNPQEWMIADMVKRITAKKLS
jgi:glutathione synthase/RimK-type ligase-like ATP-grasp enzyme